MRWRPTPNSEAFPKSLIESYRELGSAQHQARNPRKKNKYLAGRRASRQVFWMTYAVGNYIVDRLEQLGLKHYFIVPGYFKLVLLDQLLANKNLEQINCCNELDAAYAAEAPLAAMSSPCPMKAAWGR